MSDDINRVPIRVVKHIHAPNHRGVAATLAPNSGVVPVTGSRDVSDPRTDPEVRAGVRGWGRSRHGCSPAPVVGAAKDAAHSGSEKDATNVRKANAL
jgi:hypothetical protein